jgi:hypothetical protein
MTPSEVNGGGSYDGPDKRTTAYENIFGRPTAKPKGPNNSFPVPASGNGFASAAAPPPQPINHWVNQQAYLTGQSAPRYNGNPPANVPPALYRGPQQMYGYAPQQTSLQHPDMIDRRASVAPSTNSQDPRMSTYFAGGNFNHGSAADAYGGSSNQQNPYFQQAASAPYARSNSASPAPVHRPLPSIHGSQQDSNASRKLSNPALPPYISQSSNIGTFTQAELPPSPKAAPRLPSFDLTQKNDTSEDLWFSNEIGLKRNSNDRLAPSISPPVFEEDTSPGIQYLAITEGGDGDESAIADEGMYRSGMYRSSPKRWWE